MPDINSNTNEREQFYLKIFFSIQFSSHIYIYIYIYISLSRGKLLSPFNRICFPDSHSRFYLQYFYIFCNNSSIAFFSDENKSWPKITLIFQALISKLLHFFSLSKQILRKNNADSSSFPVLVIFSGGWNACLCLWITELQSERQ